MPLTLSTWNINSVRLRIDLVARFIKAVRPDVICLQETKSPDDAFPLKRFRRLGYTHTALNGQKGYHGVAVLSRLPFESVTIDNYCGKTDCRHIAVTLGEQAGLRDPVTLHNFYVPAGGDEPDPAINAKFAHKRAFLVGDLSVAPLEHDVWSHKQMLKVISHTPVETEKLTAFQRAGNWIDVARHLTPEPEKIYTWWSYRAMDNWKTADRGRRLDHVWVSPQLGDRVARIDIAKHARGWERPSDHVPVTATVEI